jgi:hypothetical protein
MGGVGNPMRQSKRLYVGNIQLTCNEATLAEFFNMKMREQGFAVEMPGEPVTSVQLNHEKSYAFVEVSLGSVYEKLLRAARADFGVYCSSSEYLKKRPRPWPLMESSVSRAPSCFE